MYIGKYLTLLVFLLCQLLQAAWTRHVAVSLNMTIATADEETSEQQPQSGRNVQELSADVLQYCMKETEMSMDELTRFREALVEGETNGIVSSIEDDGANISSNITDDDDSNIDYDGNSFARRKEESLQCFAYCLYEQLGLIKNGVFTEHDLFRKLFMLFIEHEKSPVLECMNLTNTGVDGHSGVGGTRCESFYKMHMCYNKLKSLEAERRIREILKQQESEGDYEQLGEEASGEAMAAPTERSALDEAASEENPRSVENNQIDSA